MISSLEIAVKIGISLPKYHFLDYVFHFLAIRQADREEIARKGIGGCRSALALTGPGMIFLTGD
jgi:hypothetical protein